VLAAVAAALTDATHAAGLLQASTVHPHAPRKQLQCCSRRRLGFVSPSPHGRLGPARHTPYRSSGTRCPCRPTAVRVQPQDVAIDPLLSPTCTPPGCLRGANPHAPPKTTFLAGVQAIVGHLAFAVRGRFVDPPTSPGAGPGCRRARTDVAVVCSPARWPKAGARLPLTAPLTETDRRRGLRNRPPVQGPTRTPLISQPYTLVFRIFRLPAR